jgi:hypothetical protein
MNHISLNPCRLAFPALRAALLIFCFGSPGVGLAADPNKTLAAPETTACDLLFGPSIQFDTGIQTAVALHSSGLALEFHQTHNAQDTTIWYRLGKLQESTVIWGDSQRSGVSGYLPAVTLSKEGYVILVYTNKDSKSGADLFYRVGRIDPNGDKNQTITWKTESTHWDKGSHASIAINSEGVIVGVHESHGGSSTRLYYRVGKLRNPASGDFTIQWDSGQTGIGYEDGQNPSISINNTFEPGRGFQIVEVHQVSGIETLLHYRRGTVIAGRITFAESKRYDNYARVPAVALLDNGLVLEVHSLGGLISRTGRLSRSNSTEIDWSAARKLDNDTQITHLALASNGSYAIQTHENMGYQVPEIYSSVAKVCEDP